MVLHRRQDIEKYGNPAGPRTIREVDRIPIRIPVEVQSTRDANGVVLGNSPSRTS